jgi:CubicO group peptidase (beta-lactamase class C family)
MLRLNAISGVLLVCALGCGSSASKTSTSTTTSSNAPPPDPAAAAAATQPPETLPADTPRATVGGNTFIAPGGWSVATRGSVTLLTPPEPGSTMALVDVEGADADAAVKAAWAAYKPDARWPLQLAADQSDVNGWSKRRTYFYQTSPNEKRGVVASAAFANDRWLVTIIDMADDTREKRGAQVALVFDRLFPKGYTRESFAGKTAHPLDEARIAQIKEFVTTGMEKLRIPGVSLALYQDGKVVFAGGFGVRELGKPAKVDADTRYLIASNTKGLATLMLAKLVDQGKVGWETPATQLLPSFKLGDADTTGKVLVKHLICACTGPPRQDMEWLFQSDGVTPAGAMEVLGTMQPTTNFGELFQYSNPLAAAAGYIGGHVVYPKLELGAAYDRAMQTLVFAPLGMTATTHDFAKAQRGNFSAAHSNDADGNVKVADPHLNTAVVPVRPAGGAWSTVRDLMKYVAMELAEGQLPNGKRYISKEALLARRDPQVAIGKDVTYGMGLMVDKAYDVTVVRHGGDMIGFHSDMMWLPEHGVGAVIFTNGDPGWILRSQLRRKLLEVLFDGRAEADANVAAQGQTYFAGIAAERKLLAVPAEPGEAGKLAERYASPALGEIKVLRGDGRTVFDFGEFKSEMATKKNPDGTVSFVTIAAGVMGIELVAGPNNTLVIRDPQHEYVFEPR